MRVLFAAVACFAFGLVLGKHLHATIVVPAECPPEPPDAWVRRRFAYCRDECLSLAWHVDLTAEKTTCICGPPAIGALARRGK